MSLGRSRASSTNKGILVTRSGLRCCSWRGGLGGKRRDGMRSPSGVSGPWVPTRGAGGGGGTRTRGSRAAGAGRGGRRAPRRCHVTRAPEVARAAAQAALGRCRRAAPGRPRPSPPRRRSCRRRPRHGRQRLQVAGAVALRHPGGGRRRPRGPRRAAGPGPGAGRARRHPLRVHTARVRGRRGRCRGAGALLWGGSSAVGRGALPLASPSTGAAWGSGGSRVAGPVALARLGAQGAGRARSLSPHASPLLLAAPCIMMRTGILPTSFTRRQSSPRTGGSAPS